MKLRKNQLLPPKEKDSVPKEYVVVRMVLSSDPKNEEKIKKDATLKARGLEVLYNAISEE